MPCNHTGKKKIDMVNCNRCNYNKREMEAETIIDTLNGNEKYTTKDKNDVTVTLSLNKIIIVRGHLDDCIGYHWSWK